MPSPTPRRLKIAPLYRQLRPGHRITSQLLLAGDWLKAAGFAPGAVALVEVSKGQLVITATT